MIKKIILLTFLLTHSHPHFDMNDVMNLSPEKTSEQMAEGYSPFSKKIKNATENILLA